MAKIMLVEDDKSLREIYSIRLVAEGYDVVSAGDGEEALAMAVQQKPDLIVSDVMMPKISGFDMLDILRSTPETKDIKVIMMTALSSDDQRQRGESLGADKYLVKSQVGIEDVVNAVKEVLGGTAAPTAEPVAAAPAAEPAPEAPAAPIVPVAEPAAPTTAMESAAPAAPVAEQVATATAMPAAPAAPVAEPAATPATVPVAPEQSANAAAMDALLNETPETQNANWPSGQAQ